MAVHDHIITQKIQMSINNDLDSLDSISKRLKLVVDAIDIKQSHMAEKLGILPAELHDILNNDIRFSKSISNNDFDLLDSISKRLKFVVDTMGI